MIGFKVIKEMTKDELIDEIIESIREDLNEKDVKDLKATVVAHRLEHMRASLVKEAGLVLTPGLFGGSVEEAD